MRHQRKNSLQNSKKNGRRRTKEAVSRPLLNIGRELKTGFNL